MWVVVPEKGREIPVVEGAFLFLHHKEGSHEKDYQNNGCR
jgi:hypothetical protein